MEQFIPILVLLSVGILFKVGLLPIYKRGSKSTNNILFAQTAHDSVLERTGNKKEGVDAQERSEAVWRILVPGLLLCWLPFVGVHWSLWFLATLLAQFVWVKGFQKNFDGYGHTLEIVTINDPDYEQREIASMKRQSHFSSMTIEQLQKFVDKKKPLMRLWKRIML